VLNVGTMFSLSAMNGGKENSDENLENDYVVYFAFRSIYRN
jgi:hypothetical protein